MDRRMRVDAILTSRWTRVLIGSALIVLVLYLSVPRLFVFFNEDGIVNGHYVSLHTPIEGVLTQVPPPPGTPVEKGQVLARVENHRLERSFLNELITEKNSLTRRVSALTTQINDLRGLQDELQCRLDRYRNGLVERLEAEFEEASERRLAACARLEQLRLEEKRTDELMRNGIVSEQRYEEVKYEKSAAAHTVEAAQAAVRRAEIKVALAKKNVFVQGESQNDMPYSVMRMDEIQISIEAIEARISEQQTRVAEIERQIGVERERLAKVAETELRSPCDGVVWRGYLATNDVIIGDEIVQILDSSSLFVDALVAASQYEEIEAGDELRCRFMNSEKRFKGKVAAVKGPAAEYGDPTQVAKMPMDQRRLFRVWISVSPGDLEANPANFFQIGRRVSITFGKFDGNSESTAGFFHVR